jgi:hypothetical protein
LVPEQKAIGSIATKTTVSDGSANQTPAPQSLAPEPATLTAGGSETPVDLEIAQALAPQPETAGTPASGPPAALPPAAGPLAGAPPTAGPPAAAGSLAPPTPGPMRPGSWRSKPIARNSTTNCSAL